VCPTACLGVAKPHVSYNKTLKRCLVPVAHTLLPHHIANSTSALAGGEPKGQTLVMMPCTASVGPSSQKLAAERLMASSRPALCRQPAGRKLKALLLCQTHPKRKLDRVVERRAALALECSHAERLVLDGSSWGHKTLPSRASLRLRVAVDVDEGGERSQRAPLSMRPHALASIAA